MNIAGMSLVASVTLQCLIELFARRIVNDTREYGLENRIYGNLSNVKLRKLLTHVNDVHVFSFFAQICMHKSISYACQYKLMEGNCNFTTILNFWKRVRL